MTDSLLSRLQSLTAPSREIDAEIALANGWDYALNTWRRPDGQIGYRGPPRYTESLDAALTLRPEGSRWKAGEFYLLFGDLLLADGRIIRAEADTPAIAICIACLKAKEESGK